MDSSSACNQDLVNEASETSVELDLRRLDANARQDLEGTALGLIVNELSQSKIVGTKHSSHSSYTAYSTYSMGPIG
jgi:hypothetical protein